MALNASGGKQGGASFKATFPYEKQREKLLICTPDQNVITKVYLPLMGYIQEIESFMKCKPGYVKLIQRFYHCSHIIFLFFF